MAVTQEQVNIEDHGWREPVMGRNMNSIALRAQYSFNERGAEAGAELMEMRG